mmetsp:Transcript_161307/g.517839  ORF Transcript_161307/g.517839 Transcript_161307/m.517839 type:complete len:250 (+) Transcript_161307:129-878(+)
MGITPRISRRGVIGCALIRPASAELERSTTGGAAAGKGWGCMPRAARGWWNSRCPWCCWKVAAAAGNEPLGVKSTPCNKAGCGFGCSCSCGCDSGSGCGCSCSCGCGCGCSCCCCAWPCAGFGAGIVRPRRLGEPVKEDEEAGVRAAPLPPPPSAGAPSAGAATAVPSPSVATKVVGAVVVILTSRSAFSRWISSWALRRSSRSFASAPCAEASSPIHLAPSEACVWGRAALCANSVAKCELLARSCST